MFKLKSTLKKEQSKNLLNNCNYEGKPKLKDLIAIMMAQYLILLPIIVGAIIVFGFILWLMSKFWLV